MRVWAALAALGCLVSFILGGQVCRGKQPILEVSCKSELGPLRTLESIAIGDCSEDEDAQGAFTGWLNDLPWKYQANAILGKNAAVARNWLQVGIHCLAEFVAGFDSHAAGDGISRGQAIVLDPEGRSRPETTFEVFEHHASGRDADIGSQFSRAIFPFLFDERPCSAPQQPCKNEQPPGSEKEQAREYRHPPVKWNAKPTALLWTVPGLLAYIAGLLIFGLGFDTRWRYWGAALAGIGATGFMGVIISPAFM